MSDLSIATRYANWIASFPNLPSTCTIIKPSVQNVTLLFLLSPVVCRLSIKSGKPGEGAIDRNILEVVSDSPVILQANPTCY